MCWQAPVWELCSATLLSGSPPEPRLAHVQGDSARAAQGRGLYRSPRSSPNWPPDRISVMKLVFPLLFWSAAAFPQTAAFIAVQKLSGTVGFYDAGGAHLGDAKVGMHPHEMALSADARTLYVSDNGMVWMTDKGDGENTVSI